MRHLTVMCFEEAAFALHRDFITLEEELPAQVRFDGDTAIDRGTRCTDVKHETSRLRRKGASAPSRRGDSPKQVKLPERATRSQNAAR